MTNQPVDGDAVTELFKAEQDAGRAAVAGWIFHEKVRPVIEAARADTEGLVAPIAHHLSGQGAVCALINSVLHMTWGMPNGNHGIDVLDSTTGWMVTPAVKEMLYTDFRFWLTAVAYRLASAGVPLDPDYKGDHLVIGQLLLLDIWSGEYDLLEELNYAGPTIYHVHGQGTPFVRAKRTDKATLNSSRVLDMLQQAHRGERPIGKTPYAHTGARQTTSRRTARLRALTEVLAAHPDVVPSSLLTGWRSTREGHPTHLYRTLIAKYSGTTFADLTNKKPTTRTLQRDCEELGVPFFRPNRDI